MPMDSILADIDSEIERLSQVRDLLLNSSTPRRKIHIVRKKRTMSAAARARIGAATKARWAAGKMGKQSKKRLKAA